jgi:hypothetical protein
MGMGEAKGAKQKGGDKSKGRLHVKSPNVGTGGARKSVCKTAVRRGRAITRTALALPMLWRRNPALP